MSARFQELCGLIDQNEVISFDIYDTLLLRNVLHPTDIFDIVGTDLSRRGKYQGNFKKLRVKAEEKARRLSRKEDIVLDDIYREISRDLGQSLSEEIKDLELSIERRFTVKNPFMYSVYRYAINKGKKIIFISDMYLPNEFIEQLLISNGYTQYDGLYVSGIAGVSKASGKLYEFIKSDMRIISSWMHIGDNYRSDVINPKKLNINAYHYNNIKEKIGFTHKYSVQYSILKSIQINHCETAENFGYWERFGAYFASSIIFGFTVWLVKQLVGHDNVFFLSRDGYLPHLIYNKLNEVIPGLPKANYIYASRRSFQVPNILNMNQEEALNLLTAFNSRFGQRLRIGEIFDNLGLDKSRYLETVKKFGFADFDQILELGDIARAKGMLRDIMPDIHKKLREERDSLILYLKRNGFFDAREVNIVDIGWRGSTHKAINDLTGLKLNGYYFGTTYNVYDDILDRVNSYAFHLGKPMKLMDKIMDNVMMFELIFSAPHGTLVGFSNNNGEITPILKKIEHNDYLYKCLEGIKTGVLSMVEKYLEYYEYLDNLTPEECLRDYLRFIDEKRYDDLVEFSKLTAVVGIGSAKDTQCYVTRVTIDDFKKNKRKILKDASRNLWKNAILIDGDYSGSISRKLKSPSMFLIRLAQFPLMILLIKALKNPLKATKYLIRFFSKSRYSP